MKLPRLSLLVLVTLSIDVLAGPLQDRINATPAGGTATIPAGVYHETITIPDDVFVVAEDPGNTVIDGGDAPVVVSPGANAAIIGFTIRNGSSSVANFGRFIGVFECTFDGFQQQAIRLERGSAAILHNELTGNGQSIGIGCLESNPYLAYNLIQSNAVGLETRMNFIPVAEYNIFLGNKVAIRASEGSRVLSNGNVFYDNAVNFEGQEPGVTDEVRPATADELKRVRGLKVDAYRELMKRVREEAADMQPRIIYDLTPTAGRFALICSFPWAVFHVASITKDTQIETYDAYDRQTDQGLNASIQSMQGHPAVVVSNPELTEKVHDRYVSEKIFIHPASLAYQPDGSYVFDRTTNLGRIEIRAPAGFTISTAPPGAMVAEENGRQVARLLGNGLTRLRVVMQPVAPAGAPAP